MAEKELIYLDRADLPAIVAALDLMAGALVQGDPVFIKDLGDPGETLQAALDQTLFYVKTLAATLRTQIRPLPPERREGLRTLFNPNGTEDPLAP